MHYQPSVFSVLMMIAASGLAAQNSTIPSNMIGVEGGGGTSIPFGGSMACRYQCIYDSEELPWVGPRVLTGVRIRPDFYGGSYVPPKGFIEISVLMSTCDRDSASSSSVFDENYGSDATWVIENRVMQLPAQPALPAGSVGPRAANIDFVFDAPWVYGMTPIVSGLPAPNNLLIEIWIHSQPSGSYRVDNMSTCTAPTSTFGMVGAGCSIPNNQPVELTGDSSMQAGSSYTWRISNAEPLMPFTIGLSLTGAGVLAGNPAWQLPYPLFDPANPAQPSAALLAGGLQWSAPDCYLNINSSSVLGGVSDSAGLGQASAMLPAGREFVGLTIYSQATLLAPTANPLFIMTSLGRSTTVCGPLGVARIFQFYNNNQSPPPTPPTSGSRSLGVGLVLEVF
jgi:hypothetical protein